MSDTFYTLRNSDFLPLCHSRKYGTVWNEAESLAERSGIRLTWHHFGDGSGTAIGENSIKFYITPMKFLEDQ